MTFRTAAGSPARIAASCSVCSGVIRSGSASRSGNVTVPFNNNVAATAERI
ncbi:hypothetical protein MWU75_19640 [Ornithinimicrobium sp. F0845]|uniref:hypothetical protein n=1 Tax=Ornithinimicrobium sp. F0845 TaxID=2926412 RepID=UPI001FF2DD6C|nr:hypothetical protein [Ornithinimicrobium sp. F0845]MCK0114355.1 hypothetical protein [Ornithinimicrobium sp. F0845]